MKLTDKHLGREVIYVEWRSHPTAYHRGEIVAVYGHVSIATIKLESGKEIHAKASEVPLSIGDETNWWTNHHPATFVPASRSWK